jgi:predicted Zn finger-like uncharacterized protein
MSMVTSCPGCATTFRVTPQQLQAQHGKVRCGRCAEVFDAFKALATLPDRPAPEPVAIASTPPDVPTAGKETPAPDAPPNTDPAATVQAEPQGALPFVTAEPAPVPLALELPAYRPQRRRLLWIAVGLVLLLALGAQALFRYRTEVASQVPELRAPLEHACAALGCSVGFPQRPDLLSIEGSDLQVADPAQPNRIVLTATIRNRAAVTVSHPAIELTLTNAQDQTVARRVFMPTEYVGAAAALAAGMVPNAETGVRLELDTGDLKAAGYRLFLFYP